MASHPRRILPSQTAAGPAKWGDIDDDISGNNEYQGTFVCFFGIYCSPEEFVDQAVKVDHPIHAEKRLPEALTQAIEKNATASQHSLASERVSTLKSWLARASGLGAGEEELRAKLPPRSKLVLQGKRLNLWREMWSMVSN